MKGHQISDACSSERPRDLDSKHDIVYYYYRDHVGPMKGFIVFFSSVFFFITSPIQSFLCFFLFFPFLRRWLEREKSKVKLQKKQKSFSRFLVLFLSCFFLFCFVLYFYSFCLFVCLFFNLPFFPTIYSMECTIILCCVCQKGAKGQPPGATRRPNIVICNKFD